ncbi:MAG: pyridoxamine 5'-phosphate oxidase family protein [Oscillospiraceae bacterium]|nr:pyridoxamine 5'-phosphate oxidase family protein [Oscillospiraceae bacterium]
MFREMRRINQKLTDTECAEILARGTSGVLAVSGDDGYPYAVPLSYVFADGKIYFHCAKTGHKLDALQRSDKVSFCVVDSDEVVPEKYTTYFRSVIVFGRVRAIADEAGKRAALDTLAEKYSPFEKGREAEVEGALPRVCTLVLEPEHITGKEAVELKRKKRPFGET